MLHILFVICLGMFFGFDVAVFINIIIVLFNISDNGVFTRGLISWLLLFILF
jgi:hypothetical protein